MPSFSPPEYHLLKCRQDAPSPANQGWWQPGSLHWIHLPGMSCLLTTTTMFPSNALSSCILCPSPYLEGSPQNPSSSPPLQGQVGMNFGVLWSETPTLSSSVNAHTAFSPEKWSKPFKNRGRIALILYNVKAKDADIATTEWKTVWKTAVIRTCTPKHSKSQSPAKRLCHGNTSISRVNIGGGRSSL